MARHAAALAGLALLLALLYQASLASCARVLHADPESTADTVEVTPEVVGKGLTAYGYFAASSLCDLSQEGAWDTEECSLEDNGNEGNLKVSMAKGTSLTMVDHVVEFINLPDDMTELGFETADIEVEFDNPDKADKKLYVAVLAGKSLSAMTDCVKAAQAGDDCTVPTDDIYFAWGLTDEAPYSKLGETITLGKGKAIYSSSFSSVDSPLAALANSEQLDAVRASDDGHLYVNIYLMTNQPVTIKKLGLNGMATKSVTTTPV